MYKKGDKFIVEIDACQTDPIFGPLPKGLYFIKGLRKTLLEFELNKLEKYTETEKKTYEQGLAAAWEAAYKLCCEFSMEESSQILGKEVFYCHDVFNNFSPTEAIVKIKTYEDKKKAEEEIKVGDEVLCGDIKGVVVKVWDLTVELITIECGVLPAVPFKNIKKTGRHFPQIAEVLEKMREG